MQALKNNDFNREEIKDEIDAHYESASEELKEIFKMVLIDELPMDVEDKRLRNSLNIEIDNLCSALPDLRVGKENLCTDAVTIAQFKKYLDKNLETMSENAMLSFLEILKILERYYN